MCKTSNEPHAHHESRERVRSLIEVLGSGNGMDRQSARAALAAIGPPAVPALIEALSDPARQVRWESAKALAEIADPVSADALAASLSDDDSGIRWVAAEALITLGEAGLRAALRALVDEAESTNLRQGAHHVLHAHVHGPRASEVVPVLAALDGPAAAESAPVAAEWALQHLSSALPHVQSQH